MRVLVDEQRTEAWHAARRGRITASNVNKIRAGKGTKTRKDYIDTLVLDLDDVDDFADSAPHFEFGRKLEPYAIAWYSFEKDVDVEETGFVLHPDYNYLGASPDGLIGDRGRLEVKCRRNLKTYHDACVKPITPAYAYQMQAELCVCGGDWIDYVNYWRHPGGHKEQGHIRRIMRDEAMIKEIENAAVVFWRDVVREYIRETGNEFYTFPWDIWQKRNPIKAGVISQRIDGFVHVKGCPWAGMVVPVNEVTNLDSPEPEFVDTLGRHFVGECNCEKEPA